MTASGPADPAGPTASQRSTTRIFRPGPGFAVAVAITARCESCISVHAAAAVKAGATEGEIAGALATAISLNAGAAYTYALRAFEAVESQS